MFGLFTPRYASEAQELLKSARKLLNYKKDLWSEATVTDFEAHMKSLADAVKARDEKKVAEQSKRLDDLAGKYSPPPSDAGWRENCEVLLVAIVVALGVRTYFLQPFTIPTGSMQPTLNGIIGHPTDQPLPNFFVRVVDTALKGRGYIDVQCKKSGIISDMREYSRFHFFTYTTFQCGGETYSVDAPMRILMDTFGVVDGREYRAGEVIARGYIDTGDHVFVDKFTYNFRAPRRGEVFVFNTKDIPTQENRANPDSPSQYYIKRLSGLPGDVLRIDPPNLFVNGKLADSFGNKRVMAAISPYRGYSNASEQHYLNGGTFYVPMHFLNDKNATYDVPPKNYFALGDNSFHSSDSRDWGTVPQKNIMGKGLFVYWPFNSHWGLIK